MPFSFLFILGGKNSADRSLLVDLMYWVSKNPPPAHLFLISGDRDFAGILHRLRMSNYNILLASPDSAPNVLCSAATIMWHWSSLLKGENLTGKLFNQPPDGPYNSWYGYYKAPLEDPFAVAEQSSCRSADESSLLAPESKLRPIPKAVKRHISQILSSYPEGISIVQLRNELIKSNLDKDLYGYKKFSHFLLSMPQILKLHGDAGNLLVRYVNIKYPDELVSSAYDEPGMNNGQPKVGSDSEIFNKKSSCENITEKSTVSPVSDPKVKSELSNLQEAPKEEKPIKMKMQDVKTEARAANLQDLKKEDNQRVPLHKRNLQEIQEKYSKVKLKNQTQKDEVAPPVVENNENKKRVPDDHSSAIGFGTFRRIWMKLFGSRDTKRHEASSGKDAVSQKTTEPPCAAIFSPSSHEALIDGKTAQSGDPTSEISSQNSSFSNQSSSWFKFWTSQKLDDKVGKNGETVDCLKVDTKQLDEIKVEKNSEAAHVKSTQFEIFAKELFWKEIESFIDSSQGSALFSKSRTRYSP